MVAKDAELTALREKVEVVKKELESVRRKKERPQPTRVEVQTSPIPPPKDTTKITALKEEDPVVQPQTKKLSPTSELLMKNPDEQFLHFAQIQALRDEELNTAKKKIAEVIEKELLLH